MIPVLGPPPVLHLPHVVRMTLDNGATLLVAERHDLPIVDVHVVLRTGAVADPVELAGRTSLAVDMMDEGAGHRDALEIAAAIEDLGAALQSSAGWDDVAVGLHVHADRLMDALAILADVILRPTFPVTDFERKQQECLVSLLQERDEPRILASNAFTAVVFGDDHPYGRPLHGRRSTVARIGLEDVVAYHSQFVRPDNAFFVVVGAVAAETVRTALNAMFREWARADVQAVPLPATPDSRATAIHIVDRPGSGQSELRVGGPGAPRSSPDYFPLLVLNTILGGSFTSRLNLNLRQDKGYTYGAGSAFGFRHAVGPFQASSAVHTGATEDAVRQILAELTRLRVEAVPAAELARAQSYVALGLPRTFETTEDIAAHIAEIELYGLGEKYFEEYVRRVEAVSAADVQRMAEKYLDPGRMSIVIAGDRAAIEAPLQALGVGPVHSHSVEE